MVGGTRRLIGAVTGPEAGVFFVRRSELIDRLDPLFYKEDVFSFLGESPHEALPIYKVAVWVKPGFAAGKDGQDFTGTGIIQIRPTNISEERELVFHRNIYINRDVFEHRSSDLLTRGEVLFNNTNSQELVGKTALFDIGGEFCCSNHITRIKVNEQMISPPYLAFILNSYQKRGIFYRVCTNWNNQSGVSSSLLRRIKIPCPSLRVQEEIIGKLETLKRDAARLRRAAEETMQDGIRQAEQAILGEQS
jgi:type I restriction enzyme S subunit